MKTIYTLYLEIITVVMLLMIRWPGPPVARIPCPREKAALVRKVVVKRWLPILERMGAVLPLQCPLHPIRDIFAIQESRKVHNSPQWTCGFCGKSFYHEANLDAHMENKHQDKRNEGDDATCFADFCDVMRCEVLQERLRELEESSPSATALDLWHQPLLLTSSSSRSSYTNDQAMERTLSRSLVRAPSSNSWLKSSSPKNVPPPPSESKSSQGLHFSQSSSPSSPPSTSSTSSQTSPSIPMSPVSKPPRPVHEEEEPGEVKREYYYKCQHRNGKGCSEQDDPNNETQPSTGPQELPIHPLHSWKDTCNEEHLAELRVKCQQLIQQCVSGLVLNLTLDQVRDIEGSLHRAVCWYLTCERYWEAGAFEPSDFPWGIVIGLVLLLTLGISLCYYIVWVLCESTQESNAGTPVASDPPKLIRTPRVVESCANNLKSSNLLANAERIRERRRETCGTSSRTSSLGRQPPSPSPRAHFSAGESGESECRDSGFNEGGIYPDQNEIDPSSNFMDFDSHSNRSRHYSEDSRLSLPPENDPRYYMHEHRLYNYASTFTPNYEQRRLRRNRYNYLDDFDSYSEVDADDGLDGGLSRERSDSFIYLSYPPEVKKRFTENNR